MTTFSSTPFSGHTGRLPIFTKPEIYTQQGPYPANQDEQQQAFRLIERILKARTPLSPNVRSVIIDIHKDGSLHPLVREKIGRRTRVRYLDPDILQEAFTNSSPTGFSLKSPQKSAEALGTSHHEETIKYLQDLLAERERVVNREKTVSNELRLHIGSLKSWITDLRKTKNRNNPQLRELLQKEESLQKQLYDANTNLTIAQKNLLKANQRLQAGLQIERSLKDTLVQNEKRHKKALQEIHAHKTKLEEGRKDARSQLLQQHGQIRDIETQLKKEQSSHTQKARELNTQLHSTQKTSQKLQQKKEALEKQLHEANAKVVQAEKDLSTAKQKLEAGLQREQDLQETVKQTQSALKEAQSQLQTQQAAAEKLEQTRQEALQKLQNEHNSSLDDLRKKNATLTQKLQNATRSIQQKDQASEQEKALIEERTQQLEQALVDVEKALAAKNEDYAVKLNHLRQALHAAKEKTTQLKKSLAKTIFKDVRNAFNSLTERFQKQLGEMQAKTQSLENELLLQKKEARQEKEGLQKQLHEANTNLATTQKDLYKAKKELENERQIMGFMRTLLGEAAMQMNAKTQELDSLNALLKQEKAAHLSAKKEVAKSRRLKEDLKKELQAVKSDVIKTKKSLEEEFSSAFNTLKEASTKQLQENLSLLAKKEHLEKAQTSLIQKLKALTKEKEELSTRTDNTLELAKDKADILRLKREKATQKKQNARIKEFFAKTMSEMRSQRDTLDDANTKLKIHCERLTADLTSSNRVKHQAQAELEALQKAYSATRDSLRSKVDTLAQKNTTIASLEKTIDDLRQNLESAQESSLQAAATADYYKTQIAEFSAKLTKNAKTINKLRAQNFALSLKKAPSNRREISFDKQKQQTKIEALREALSATKSDLIRAQEQITYLEKTQKNQVNFNKTLIARNKELAKLMSATKDEFSQREEDLLRKHLALRYKQHKTTEENIGNTVIIRELEKLLSASKEHLITHIEDLLSGKNTPLKEANEVIEALKRQKAQLEKELEKQEKRLDYIPKELEQALQKQRIQVQLEKTAHSLSVEIHPDVVLVSPMPSPRADTGALQDTGFRLGDDVEGSTSDSDEYSVDIVNDIRTP